MVKLTKISWEIFYESTDTKDIEIIEKSLTFYNENSRFSNNNYWDGYIRYFDKKRKCFNFGHLSPVIDKLIQKDIQYTISGIDIEVFQPTVSYNKELRPHQLASLYSFFQTKYGVIKVPTRGGKTYIASEAIRLIQYKNTEFKVLFVVDSQMLFNQALNDISSYLKINKEEIGIIKDGKFIIKQINITTIQTLQSIHGGVKRIKKTKAVNKVLIKKTNQEIKGEKNIKLTLKQNLIDFLSDIKFLIVDECHEYSSDDRINIIKQTINSEFNLFLSATPFKSENRFANLSLRGIIGDILYEIPEQELKKRGVLAQDKVILIRIRHKDNKYINFNELDNYQEYVDKVIVSNKERNQIVVNVIETCRKMKLKTLVLFSFKKHGYNISKLTSDPFITGDNGLEDREFVKEKFLKEGGGVLLASNIFNKGITLPEVEIMVNIGGGKEKSGLIQKKGRVLGTTKTKKKALIIDFLDESEYFSDHSLSRLEVYEESVGSENIIVFDSNDEDFYVEFREFVKQWFDEDIQNNM
jgi:superfamily II DNA or RNA helicase